MKLLEIFPSVSHCDGTFHIGQPGKNGTILMLLLYKQIVSGLHNMFYCFLRIRYQRVGRLSM